jgi:hypothetical protein
VPGVVVDGAVDCGVVVVVAGLAELLPVAAIAAPPPAATSAAAASALRVLFVTIAGLLSRPHATRPASTRGEKALGKPCERRGRCGSATALAPYAATAAQ